MRTLSTLLLFSFVGLLAVDLEPGTATRAERGRRAGSRRDRPAGGAETVEVAFVRDGRLRRVERVVREGATPRGVRAARAPTGADEGRACARVWNGDSPRRPASARSARRDDTWLVSFSRSLLSSGTARRSVRGSSRSRRRSRPLGPERYVAVSTEGRFVTLLRLGARLPARPAHARRAGLPVQPPRRPASTLDARLPRPLRGDRDARLRDIAVAPRLPGVGAARPHRDGDGLDAAGPPARDDVRCRRASLRGAGSRSTATSVCSSCSTETTSSRAVHTSTGSFGRTPPGSFRVYRKEIYSWSRAVPRLDAVRLVLRRRDRDARVPGRPLVPGLARLRPPAGRGCEARLCFVGIGTPVNVF